MKRILFISLILLFLTACKSSEKEEPKSFISTLSLIENQVAHVDTSLYFIVQVTSTDTLPPDTTYIPREKFREAAKEFLAIPDLSDPRVAKRFKEEPARYDETINRAILTYTPVDPSNEEYKSQELLVTPSVTGDKVNNIIIKRMISNRNGFMQKNMLWVMDRSFQVTTITQEPAKPEKVTTIRVTWNEDTGS